jgi:hypothetical protein
LRARTAVLVSCASETDAALLLSEDERGSNAIVRSGWRSATCAVATEMMWLMSHWRVAAFASREEESGAPQQKEAMCCCSASASRGGGARAHCGVRLVSGTVCVGA